MRMESVSLTPIPDPMLMPYSCALFSGSLLLPTLSCLETLEVKKVTIADPQIKPFSNGDKDPHRWSLAPEFIAGMYKGDYYFTEVNYTVAENLFFLVLKSSQNAGL